MSKIVTVEDINKNSIDYSSWTFVLPAAGKGTRLAYDKPKILFKIKNKTILEWILEAINPSVLNIVLVVSEEGKNSVEDYVSCLDTKDRKIMIALQNRPLGMAHAVNAARELCTTKNVCVLWGDQVTVNRETIEACMYAHENLYDPLALTFPAITKEDSYIGFKRDSGGKILKVKQKREGDVLEGKNENDCGLFCFNREALFEVLEKAIQNSLCMGAVTGEYNLLPLIPEFYEYGEILTVKIQNIIETLGINSLEDVKIIKQHL